MFQKLGLLALVTPLVAGLRLFIPENPTSSGTVTIRWEFEAGDPAQFSFELINDSFNNAFAIANNVIPELGEITITLPVVPVGAGYTLQAVNVGDINEVYAETPEFAIGPNGATSVSSQSITTTLSSTTSGSSTASSVTPTTTATSTDVATTVTTPVSSPTSLEPAESNTAPPAEFTNAAGTPAKLNANLGAVAAVLLSAAAGAVFLL